LLVLVAGCWFWLLVAGCWLLVAGFWLLVAGYWLLLLITGYEKYDRNTTLCRNPQSANQKPATSNQQLCALYQFPGLVSSKSFKFGTLFGLSGQPISYY